MPGITTYRPRTNPMTGRPDPRLGQEQVPGTGNAVHPPPMPPSAPRGLNLPANGLPYQPGFNNGVQYNTRGIGFEHYHDMLAQTGFHNGMNPQQARQFSMQQWALHGRQGTQGQMIQKMAQFYGQPQAAATTDNYVPLANKSPIAAPTKAPAQQNQPNGAYKYQSTPPDISQLTMPVSAGVPRPGATAAAPAPATPPQPQGLGNDVNFSATSPVAGATPPVPRPPPPRTNDPALSARLSAQGIGPGQASDGKSIFDLRGGKGIVGQVPANPQSAIPNPQSSTPPPVATNSAPATTDPALTTAKPAIPRPPGLPKPPTPAVAKSAPVKLVDPPDEIDPDTQKANADLADQTTAAFKASNTPQGNAQMKGLASVMDIPAQPGPRPDDS